MIVFTVIGNILVCLSVILVRKLRHPSNYLLVSFFFFSNRKKWGNFFQFCIELESFQEIFFPFFSNKLFNFFLVKILPLLSFQIDFFRTKITLFTKQQQQPPKHSFENFLSGNFLFFFFLIFFVKFSITIDSLN